MLQCVVDCWILLQIPIASNRHRSDDKGAGKTRTGAATPTTPKGLKPAKPPRDCKPLKRDRPMAAKFTDTAEFIADRIEYAMAASAAIAIALLISMGVFL